MKKTLLIFAIVVSFFAIQNSFAQERKSKHVSDRPTEFGGSFYDEQTVSNDEIDLAVRPDARSVSYTVYVNTVAACRIHVLAITDQEAIHACNQYKIRTFIDHSDVKTGVIYFQIFSDNDPKRVLGEATAMADPCPLRI